jgi:hypothetical protein
MTNVKSKSIMAVEENVSLIFRSRKDISPSKSPSPEKLDCIKIKDSLVQIPVSQGSSSWTAWENIFFNF